jgi:hypothetical protein
MILHGPLKAILTIVEQLCREERQMLGRTIQRFEMTYGINVSNTSDIRNHPIPGFFPRGQLTKDADLSGTSSTLKSHAGAASKNGTT